MLNDQGAELAPVGLVHAESVVEDVASHYVCLRLCLLAYISEVQCGNFSVAHSDVLFDQVLDLQFQLLGCLDVVSLEVQSNHVVDVDGRPPFN